MKGLTLRDRALSRADKVLQISTAVSRSLDRRAAAWHQLSVFFRFGADLVESLTFGRGSQVAFAQSVKETR